MNYHYACAGFEIDSDVELPILSGKGETGDGTLQIRQEHLRASFADNERPGAYFEGRQIRFTNDYCFLVISKSGITYEKKENTSDEMLHCFVLGYGLALYFHLRGELGIHCSALSRNGGAVLIAGDSGAGKSTLANSLIGKGYRFLADDLARVVRTQEGELFAYPMFPAQKLCKTEVLARGMDTGKLQRVHTGEEEKYYLPMEQCFESAPLPVKALFLLRKGDVPEPAVRKLSGQTLLERFAECVFILHISDTEFRKPEFVFRCLQYLEHLDVYELVRPAEGESAEALAEIVQGCIG